MAQIFSVELEDGTVTEAELLSVLEIEGKTYAVYSVLNGANGSGDETVDIMASYVVKDEEGYDELKTIEDPGDRDRIMQAVSKLIEAGKYSLSEED